MTNLRHLLSLCLTAIAAGSAAAQSSSLMRIPQVRISNEDAQVRTYDVKEGAVEFRAVQPDRAVRPATRAIERTSMIAVPPTPPRKFEPNMLIKIIVRQHKDYTAEGDYEADKKWKLDALLSRWLRFHPHNRLGADELNAGEPGVKFDLKNKYETESDAARKDKFTTHITARIIDVKPNGNLVLQASQSEIHDDNEYTMTLTGVCRSEDVTPDNTILSSQIAELRLEDRNKGAVHDATQRGWIPRVLDWLKPM